ncbi:MAG: hypothetical protein AAFQ32_12750 [Pseudomonadota bacterium]
MIAEDQIVGINELELPSVEYFRVALSEQTHELRKKAIGYIKHDICSDVIDMFVAEPTFKRIDDRARNDVLEWVATTAQKRQDAAHELGQISKRYDRTNERKLNVAECIGRKVWLSIRERKFEGLQTANGILEQVRTVAKKENVSGARDKDTIREIWNAYRGVFHLGMAIDHREDYPETTQNVLFLAEAIRRELSEHCPRGTKKPYVDASEQIIFVYKTELWGPRFKGRGLPFYKG